MSGGYDHGRHNYVRKLNKLYANGTIVTKGFADVEVRHDDDCKIFLGDYCDCDPDIIVTQRSEG